MKHIILVKHLNDLQVVTQSLASFPHGLSTREVAQLQVSLLIKLFMLVTCMFTLFNFPLFSISPKHLFYTGSFLFLLV